MGDTENPSGELRESSAKPLQNHAHTEGAGEIQRITRHKHKQSHGKMILKMEEVVRRKGD